MSRRARIALLAAALAAGVAASALAREPSHTLRVPTPSNPTPVPPEPVAVPPPSGPCGDPAKRCPDLVVRAPSELRVLRGRNGRVRLGSRNRLVNRGSGPLFLLGERKGRRTMTVSQRVYSVTGGHVEYPLPEARFDLWAIPRQGSFWKLRDALRFELWTAGGPVEQFVKLGRKTRFCMRDLFKARGLRGPRHRKFPACSQSSQARSVRMGLSRGWVESYPAGYYEQYVDVTRLRGCYSLRHVVDPLGQVLESDESNNMSQTRVRLPPRRGRVRGC